MLSKHFFRCFQFVPVTPDLTAKDNFCIKIDPSWNSGWNSFPLNYILKTSKMYFTAAYSGLPFLPYPNELDLDTRTGLAIHSNSTTGPQLLMPPPNKFPLRPSHSFPFCHMNTTLLVTSSFLLLVLPQHPP